MLRKDVKLGFAIGGVMLAVLVVYVLVVPGTDHKGTQVVIDDNGTPAKTDLVNADPKAVDTKPDTDKPPVDTTKIDSAKADSAKPDTSKVDAPIAPPVTPPAPAPVAKTNDAGQDIWAMALNNGTPPTMMSRTPVAENKGAKAITPPAPTPDQTTGKTTDKQPTDSATDKPSDTVVDKTAPTGSRTHVVQKGETLSSIAIAVYSDAKQWKRISEANPKVNPNRLKLGTTLVIPDAAAATPAVTATDSAVPASATTPGKPAAVIDPQTEYQVQANDSLYRISNKLYGNGTHVDKIYEANKETIGTDRAKLKLHMILKLAEPPTNTLATASR